MTDGPSKPLTPVERMVCDCVARGWGYSKIAKECQIEVNTAYVHVSNIAAKLPWEEDVRPYHRVFLWLQHREWLLQHVSRTPEARRARAEEAIAQRQEERDRRALERRTALEQIMAKTKKGIDDAA